jgi:hypothetical protein
VTELWVTGIAVVVVPPFEVRMPETTVDSATVLLKGWLATKDESEMVEPDSVMTIGVEAGAGV